MNDLPVPNTALSIEILLHQNLLKYKSFYYLNKKKKHLLYGIIIK